MRYIKNFNESKEIGEDIKSICKDYEIYNYKINSDGTIDVEGSVHLYKRYLTKLPLKFGKVSENFNCQYNYITSLEGAPSYVGEDFMCYCNKLTSLEGAPSYVVGDFYCHQNNNLTSIVGAPLTIGGDFFCADNNIISFEGFPKSVGDFSCGGSPISNVWKLFRDVDKIELFNEFDIIRGNNLVIDRLNDFLVTIGKEPVDNVEDYNNI